MSERKESHRYRSRNGGSSSSRSRSSSSSKEKGSRKKKRIRRHRDPLDEKVRQLRRVRERHTIQRQKVERQVLILSGVLGILLTVIITISLLADWICPYCVPILMTIAIVSLIVWVIFKVRELISVQQYRNNRNSQRDRDLRLAEEEG